MKWVREKEREREVRRVARCDRGTGKVLFGDGRFKPGMGVTIPKPAPLFGMNTLLRKLSDPFDPLENV